MGIEFNDPVVGGTALVRAAIHSPDYVAGSTGWTINRDGTAEFNSITVRGTLTVIGPSGAEIIIQPSITNPEIRFYSPDHSNSAFINLVPAASNLADLGINSGQFTPPDSVLRRIRIWMSGGGSNAGIFQVMRDANQDTDGGFFQAAWNTASWGWADDQNSLNNYETINNLTKTQHFHSNGTAAAVVATSDGTLPNNRYLGLRRVGDTDDTFRLDWDGNHGWGPVGGPGDVSLARDSSGVLVVSRHIEDANPQTWLFQGATTTTGAFSAETILGTLASFNFLAHRTYRISYQFQFNVAATGVVMLVRIRDTNISGTIRGTMGFPGTQTGNVPHSAKGEFYLKNTTNATIARAMAVTAAGSGGSIAVQTDSGIGTTYMPWYIRVDEERSDTDIPWAVSL